jgi:hypothetical protein
VLDGADARVSREVQQHEPAQRDFGRRWSGAAARDLQEQEEEQRDGAGGRLDRRHQDIRPAVQIDHRRRWIDGTHQP